MAHIFVGLCAAFLHRRFGKQEYLFADAFTDVRKGESYGDEAEQLEVRADVLCVIIPGRFDLGRVRAAEADFPGGLDDQ